MKLSVSERLAFATVFPPKSTIAEQILVRDIAKKVEVSQKEGAEVELSVADNKLNMQKADALVREFEFTDPEIGFLKSRANKMNEQKEVAIVNLSLILKIQDEKCQTKE